MAKKTEPTQNKRGLNTFLVFILFIFIYLLIRFFLGFSYTEESQVSIKNGKPVNSSPNFYIYEQEDPLKFTYQDPESLLLYNPPLTVAWKPKEYPLRKTISLSATISADFDMELKVNCKPCSRNTETSTYNFFLKDLVRYKSVKKLGDNYIYSKTPLKSTASTMSQWLKEESSQNSTMTIVNNALSLSEIVNPDINYKENSRSSIQTDLMGTHSFYVYMNKDFEMQVRFRNRDYADIGQSSALITLEDLNGDIIFEESTSFLSKENLPTDSYTRNYQYRNLPHSGVYKLSIITQDNIIIKTLDINTNKIVLNDYAKLSRENSLYTALANHGTLNVLASSYNGLGNISVKKRSHGNYSHWKETTLTNANLAAEKAINLTPGTYKITTAKEQQLQRALLSFSQEQFFNPFTYELREDLKAEYVVTNFLQEVKDNEASITYFLNTADLKKLNSLNRVEFLFMSQELANSFEKSLATGEAYTHIGRVLDYQIYSNSEDVKVKGASTLNKGESAVVELKNLLPEESTLLFRTENLFPQDLFIKSKGDEQVNTQFRKTDLHLLGDHQFYIMTADLLKLSTEIDPYLSDQIFQIQLRDSTGKIVCEKNIYSESSDKLTLDVECKTEEKGIYVLSIRSQRQEFFSRKDSFEIVSLQANTDKIMVKGIIRTIEKVKVYTESSQPSLLSFTSIDDMTSLKVTSRKVNRIVVSELQDTEQTDILRTLVPGTNEINIGTDNTLIRGANFAFKKSSLFNPYSHYLTDDINLNPDFVIGDYTTSNGILFKKISINVQ